MIGMETEEQSGPSRRVLIALGVVMVVVGALIAAELAVPLQPGIVGKSTFKIEGTTVVMPDGLSLNTKLNYVPQNITVVIGVNNTVNFVNEDTATHTVTATDGSFDSGNIVAGANWTHTFSTAGTFTFYCKYHFWMKGTITVLEP